MKKFIILLIILLTSITSINVVPANAEESNDNNQQDLNLAENSKSALLLERDTGKILYEKNAHEQLPPASMTKIMTLILIMEALDDEKVKLDEMVRVSEYAASMGGSQIFLEAGEEMKVNDLLKGIAVASGNDASVAMAERIAGSEEAFVTMMNQKAKELGLENTKFQNTTGLPADNHFSTAYDLAMMAKELLKHEEITNYTSIYEDYLRKGTEDEFWLVNTNKLVKFYDGVDGLKTGYTSQAKYCLTATAKKGNMRTVAVVLGADTSKNRNSDVTQMLDYAFSQYDSKQLFESKQSVSKLQMIKAAKNEIDVVTGESVSVVFEKGDKLDGIETNVKMNSDINLPLSKGDQVGTLEVKKDGKVLSVTPLIVNEDVEKAGFWHLFKRSMDKMVKKG
ncbi:D-alanyl-D-alanine carboxypeptidase [Aquibacillus koreensis]|uniref:serine-type D-Ala-D-Ala carboxypeptidase n=1 Tax=Aquibacillus koreensis TaxID=279446 RepID=A0A9X3WHV3_9BACI|nr:D-alanyl-D-alanine carboxypeptidase family protein [Aquibacillus koreensis]MCT2537447.1 D-alanyl-D-alanine carboxypeptidase [Aquibacillus koreensis]MDC3418893.1 D-alanyl-D-alanine carboxypeptidase [Aquibacillus koreensis]